MLRINSNYLAPAVGLRTDMDQLIADVFGTPNDATLRVGGRRGHPAVDIWEENEEYFIALDVPGLSESEVKITALGRELTLEGGAAIEAAIEAATEATDDSKAESPETEPTYFHRERKALCFKRVIRFPVEIDVQHVEGNLQAGVLQIRVPKVASASPCQIEIQTR